MGLRSFYKVIGNCLGHHGTSLLQTSRGLGFGIYRKQNDHVEIGTVASLGVVCSLLGSDVLASIWKNNKLRLGNVELQSVSIPLWTNMTV